MKKRWTSFTLLLPIVDIVLWIALVIVPTLFFFFRLKHAANGSESLSLSFGDFQTIVRSDRFLAFSFGRAGLVAEKWITVLDAPAKFVEPIMSLILFRTPNWVPSSLLAASWRSLIYPIYALPAWIYVGRGVDGFLGRIEVRRGNLIASLVLTILSLLFFGILRFGLSPSERDSQDLLNWYIKGFALWAVLFALPSAAWFRQRTRRSVAANKLKQA